MTTEYHDQDTADRFVKAIEALQGPAFPTDGLRGALVAAWAQGAAVGAKWLDDVLAGLSPATAGDLLEDLWDQRMALPNDAARTVEERQRRAAAFNSIREATPERINAVLRALAIDTSVSLLRCGQYAAGASSKEFSAQLALLVDDVVFDDVAMRRSIDKVMRRLLPAKLHPMTRRSTKVTSSLLRSSHEERSILCTLDAAQWSDVRSAALGKTALSSVTAGVLGTNRPEARKVRFGPRAIPSARDLNDALSYQCFPTVAGSGAGGFYAWFAMTLPGAGATTVIDSSRDYNDRFIHAVGVHSGSDIRPQGAAAEADADQIVASYNLNSFFFGGDNASIQLGDTLAAGQGRFVVNAAGALAWQSLDDAGTRYAIGLVWASGVSGVNESEYTDQRASVVYTDANDWGDVFPADWLEAFNLSTFAKSSATTALDYGGDSGLRRVAQCIAFQAGEVVVIDSSDVWRDRIITVGLIELDDNKWLGINGDDAGVWGEEIAFYSGEGAADADALAGASTWTYSFGGGGAEIRMWARDTDGALCMGLIDTAAAGSVSYALLINASGPTGEYIVETLPIHTYPSAGDPIYPIDLNLPQDCGFYEQAHQGYPEGAVRPPRVGSLPLGTAANGEIPIAIEIESSALDGKENATTFIERQKIADALRITWFGVVPSSSSVEITGADDWSERIIKVCAHTTGTDETPVGVGVGPWAGFFYRDVRYTGRKTFQPLYIHADVYLNVGSNGELLISNTDASPLYVSLYLDAGPRIGERRV